MKLHINDEMQIMEDVQLDGWGICRGLGHLKNNNLGSYFLENNPSCRAHLDACYGGRWWTKNDWCGLWGWPNISFILKLRQIESYHLVCSSSSHEQLYIFFLEPEMCWNSIFHNFYLHLEHPKTNTILISEFYQLFYETKKPL